MWVLTLLVVLAAVPRYVTAVRRTVLATDAVYFLERAEACRQGDGAGLVADLGLNLYPPILALGGWLTGDMEWAGRWWSLLCASLVVLPLFGLVRRMLDDRVAIVAAVLYAAHPEAIDWSPEIIRDPQFWLLFTSGLYAAWRATSEGGWGWFATGGLAVTAATLTRFEGWFLWVPLTLWTGLVLRARRGETSRWLGGWAVSLAMIPLVTVAVNLTCLPAGTPWQWGRTAHVEMAVDWLRAQGAGQTSPVAEAERIEPSAPGEMPSRSRAPQSSARAPRPVRFQELSWGVRHTVWRGAHPVILILAAAGWLLAGRRYPGRRAFLIGLDLVALLVVASMTIYLWDRDEINKRYVIPLVLVVLPYAGLGLVEFVGAATHLRSALGGRGGPARPAPWRPVWNRSSAAAAAVCCAGLVVGGWREAWQSTYESRYLKAELGTWLRLEYGPHRSLLVSENMERLVGHYAQAQRRSLPDEVNGNVAAEWLERHQPELVVLRQDGNWAQAYRDLLASAADNYETLDPAQLPPSCRNVKVLVRRPLWAERRRHRPTDELTERPDQAPTRR